MAGFLYFFSKRVATRADVPTECNLAAVFDGGSVQPCPVTDGPSKDAGTVVALSAPPGGKDPICGYYPARQTWRECRNGPTVTHWIGWETDAPPGPDDLVKSSRLKGHPVTLMDGREWVVPVVGPSVARTSLPTLLTASDGQTVELSVVERFAPLFARSAEFFDYAMRGGRVMYQDVLHYCVDVLAVNYRVGIHEAANVLKLVGDECIDEVIAVSVGKREIEKELAAKKAEATPPAG